MHLHFEGGIATAPLCSCIGRVEWRLLFSALKLRGWDGNCSSVLFYCKGGMEIAPLHFSIVRVGWNLLLCDLILRGWDKKLLLCTLVLQGRDKNCSSNSWLLYCEGGRETASLCSFIGRVGWKLLLWSCITRVGWKLLLCDLVLWGGMETAPLCLYIARVGVELHASMSHSFPIRPEWDGNYFFTLKVSLPSHPCKPSERFKSILTLSPS